MTALALSGWAQYPESLSGVMPEGATYFSYGALDCASCLAGLGELPDTAPDVAVGWSLGGQLLVRAVAAGVLRPKRLVLLGAPFQLVADAQFRGGKARALVAVSRLALLSNPSHMLREFQSLLLAQGDSNAAHIRALSSQYLAADGDCRWLEWFDELMRFSCRELDFSGFPPTDIIHGVEDFVIPFANAEAFAERISGAKLHRLEHCGHAPHWHDASFVRYVITGS